VAIVWLVLQLVERLLCDTTLIERVCFIEAPTDEVSYKKVHFSFDIEI
jgi:hypothetical protein